jgi:hypothetical protein
VSRLPFRLRAAIEAKKLSPAQSPERSKFRPVIVRPSGDGYADETEVVGLSPNHHSRRADEVLRMFPDVRGTGDEEEGANPLA